MIVLGRVLIGRVLLCLLLLSGCSSFSTPEPEGPLSGDRLIEALRKGGLVLYLRHTATTEAGSDDLRRPEQCAGQRSLTDAGRQDARAIGRALDELGVPVGRVVASPICRTRETAVLAFGEADTDRALLPIEAEPVPEQVAAGRRLLAERPRKGANTFLVGHISNVRALAGAEPAEGGAVVFRPEGDGEFRIVGEVAPQGFQRLAGQD